MALISMQDVMFHRSILFSGKHVRKSMDDRTKVNLYGFKSWLHMFSGSVDDKGANGVSRNFRPQTSDLEN